MQENYISQSQNEEQSKQVKEGLSKSNIQGQNPKIQLSEITDQDVDENDLKNKEIEELFDELDDLFLNECSSKTNELITKINNFDLKDKKKYYFEDQENIKSNQRKQNRNQDHVKQRWNKLKNVVQGVINLRHYEVEALNDKQQLQDQIDQYKIFKTQIAQYINKKDEEVKKQNNQAIIQNKKRDLQNKAIDEFKREQQILELCLNGGQDSVGRLHMLIEEDPRINSMSSFNPNHPLNKKDANGLFPLYIACTNGNYEVVKYLIRREVDHNQVFHSKDNKIKEESIWAAIRWKHYSSVLFILQHCQFTKDNLKKMLDHVKDKAIVNELKTKIRKMW